MMRLQYEDFSSCASFFKKKERVMSKGFLLALIAGIVSVNVLCAVENNACKRKPPSNGLTDSCANCPKPHGN